MNKYTKYKYSGIEWLGEIPNEWKVTRLKNLGFLQNGVSKGKEYFGFGFPFVSYGNVYNDSINLEKIKKLANSTDEDQKLYSVLEGDVFFTRTSETIDEIGISATALKTIPKATFSGFVIRLRPNKIRIYKGFSKYYFQGNINRLFLSKQINIVTRASLSQSILNNLPVLLPPLKEQTQIANYLDSKTTAIDKKIKLLQQKTSHYKAYRKTLINETVTKGLDKTVKLKDSGISWIGEIPEHWEVKRLKDVSKIFTGNSISDKSLFEVKKDTYNYIATKDINIHTKAVNYDNGVYIPKSDNSFKITKKDTSLICLEGASAGKKLTFVEKEVAFVNKLCAIKSFDKKVLDKYIFYLLQTNLFNSQFFELLSGLIGGVSLGLLKYFNILVPTKKEQQQIAAYLDTKTATIDKIIKNIETQITTLKELRKTIINEVVTGKVKITT